MLSGNILLPRLSNPDKCFAKLFKGYILLNQVIFIFIGIHTVVGNYWCGWRSESKSKLDGAEFHNSLSLLLCRVNDLLILRAVNVFHEFYTQTFWIIRKKYIEKWCQWKNKILLELDLKVDYMKNGDFFIKLLQNTISKNN